MRPKQWIKNLFLFAAIIFVKEFTDFSKLLTVVFAFILFCLAASAVYLVNDLLDFEQDRNHPKKRSRPIASGKLSQNTAWLVAALLIVLSLGNSLFINPYFAMLIANYILLNILYSFYLKRVVIIDVIVVAAGFLIRVIAGAVAIGVTFSQWLILSTFFLTLFLGISKRKNELAYPQNSLTRTGLNQYSPQLLDQMNMIVLPSTIITYAFYTFSSEHSKLLMVTIPIVLYGLFRYLFLISVKETIDDGPTDDLLFDKHLLVTVFIWLIVSAGIILYAG